MPSHKKDQKWIKCLKLFGNRQNKVECKECKHILHHNNSTWKWKMIQIDDKGIWLCSTYLYFPFNAITNPKLHSLYKQKGTTLH